MDREQKGQVVEEIASELGSSDAVFAIDYRGISVPQAAELRGKLREADASFNVVKNRLARLAAEKAGNESLDELLQGPTALTYIRGDVVLAAKAISTFNREHDVLTFKGGLMDGEPLDSDRFSALAKLPALEVMHGQLVGTVAAPLTGLVRGLGGLVSGLAIALGQIAEQGLVSGEAPEPEAEPQDAGSDPSPEETPEPAEAQAEAQAAGSDPSPEETPEPAEAQGSDPSGSEEVTPEVDPTEPPQTSDNEEDDKNGD